MSVHVLQDDPISFRYGSICVPETDNVIGQSIRLYGEWAQIELMHHARFIPKGGTVLDIGACFGTHALAFANMVGENGHVVAVDASDVNYSFLTQNVIRNGLASVVRTMSAIVGSGSEQPYVLHQRDENFGTSTVSVAVDAGATLLPSVRIDQMGCTRVDFIKIDVEGMEAEVIRGTSQILSDQRPVVFCDVTTVAGALRIMSAFDGYDYIFYSDVTPSFNRDNFLGSKVNIFGENMECGLYAIPAERKSEFFDVLSELDLPIIETADDIVLMLSQKPQYFDEMLSVAASASRFSRSTRNQINERNNSPLFVLHEKLAKNKEKINKLETDNKRIINNSKIFSKDIEIINRKLEMSKIIAKKLRRFPFSLYFRVKKKYRKILKQIQNAKPVHVWDLTGTPPVSHSHQSHPAGYKGESLRHLQMSRPVEALPVGDFKQAMASLETILPFLEGRKPLLISFSHDNYLDNVGGTQLCVGLEQVEAQAAGCNYLHVYPLHHVASLAPDGDPNQTSIGFSLNGTALGAGSYHTLTALAEKRKIDGLHTYIVINHIMSHVPEAIARIIKATGDLRCIWWLHDFFTLCSSPHLLRNNVTFCGAPDPVSTSCNICAYGPVRIKHMDRILAFFSEIKVNVLTPSNFVADLFRSRTSLPYASLTVQPHLDVVWKPAPSVETPANTPVRVAFLGAPVHHKGWPNFREMAIRYEGDAEYEFMYFGSHKVDEDIKAFQVSVTSDNRLAMVDALRDAGVDVVLHISPTPESFSFTAYEALAAGAMVLTNRGAGNVSQLVERLGCGIVIGEESDLAAVFDTGQVKNLAYKARLQRKGKRADLHFSRMAVGLLISEGML